MEATHHIFRQKDNVMQNQQGLGIQIVAHGSVLPEHSKDGKTYIAAPWNTDYQLRLLVPRIPGYRHPNKRFLVVVSVDGLDIMTGKRATAQSGGYIITPASHSTANDIPGYRLNDREVARFRFGDRTDSYAAKLERPENVGTIGVIVFSEYDPAPVLRSTFRSSHTFGAEGGTRGGGGNTRGGHDMGTEFGGRADHVVTRDHFEKEREVARFTLEYASRESLLSAGIITSSPLGEVRPFADTGCQPPRDWRG
jgi:hypothetical protein